MPPIRPPTVAPIHEADREVSPSFSSQTHSDLSGLAPMPLNIDMIEPIPEKKPSKWKRLFGLGRKKKDKGAQVVVKHGKGKLEKKRPLPDSERKTKSFVDWD